MSIENNNTKPKISNTDDKINDSTNTTANNAKSMNKAKLIIIAILSVLFFPIGIIMFFVWKRNYPKESKIVLICGIISLIIGIIGVATSPPSESTKGEKIDKKVKVEEKKKVDASVVLEQTDYKDISFLIGKDWEKDKEDGSVYYYLEEDNNSNNYLKVTRYKEKNQENSQEVLENYVKNMQIGDKNINPTSVAVTVHNGVGGLEYEYENDNTTYIGFMTYYKKWFYEVNFAIETTKIATYENDMNKVFDSIALKKKDKENPIVEPEKEVKEVSVEKDNTAKKESSGPSQEQLLAASDTARKQFAKEAFIRPQSANWPLFDCTIKYINDDEIYETGYVKCKDGYGDEWKYLYRMWYDINGNLKDNYELYE